MHKYVYMHVIMYVCGAKVYAGYAPFPTLALVDAQTSRIRRPSARLTSPSPNTLPAALLHRLHIILQLIFKKKMLLKKNKNIWRALSMEASQLVSNFQERKKLSERFSFFSRPVFQRSTVCAEIRWNKCDNCYGMHYLERHE